MGAILKREFGSFFNSAIAYVVMAVFFFFSGLFFYTAKKNVSVQIRRCLLLLQALQKLL